MKLFLFLLLAISVIAAAVPAPEVARPANDTVTSKPLEIDHPAASMGGTQDLLYFDYKFSVVESCNSGIVHPSGTWSHQLFTAHFDLDGVGSVYVKVNGKALYMNYDFQRHATNYTYGDCQWGSDSLTSKVCGFCVDGRWSDGALNCGQDVSKTRLRDNWCYIRNGDSSAQAAQEEPQYITPRDNPTSAEPSTTVVPDVPIIFDVTVDPASPVVGDLLGSSPEFWVYNLTIIEQYLHGDLVARGLISAPGLATTFFLDQNEQRLVWAKVNDKYLQIFYDYKKHWASFAYDSSHWGMDIWSADGRGFCRSIDGWDRPVLPPNSRDTDLRIIDLYCWIYLGDTSTQSVQKKSNSIAARELAPQSDATAVITTVAQPLTILSTGTTGSLNDRIGYYSFTVSVTEYCEASKGTPLRANGWWSVGDSSSGQKVSFDDGRTATSFNLGFSNNNLLVGPYDYKTHRLGLHYGGCHWDQDIKGVGNCGFCVSRPWSSPELDCATNAAAARNHRIDCMVAVQYGPV